MIQRLMLILSVCYGAFLLLPSAVQGEDYPAKPIRIVVPWPAGGVADARVRLLSQRLALALSKPVTVENKPGASGVLGAESVARAAPDGYTLLFGSFVDQAVVLGTVRSLPYDPAKQFVPVALMGRSCLVLAVHESLRITSVDELVSRARASPGKLSYATAGRGTGQHLLMEQLKHVAGVDIVPVHYKGSAPALTDVIAGHVPILFEYPGVLAPHVRNGPLRALMTACKHRNELFPTVPTSQEAGYPDVGVLTWSGIFAPAGTARSVVTRLNNEINKFLSLPDVRGNTSFSGAELPLLTPEEFAKLIEEERPRWVQLVRVAGIEPE